MSRARTPGPLSGVRVLEVGGIGPVPYAGMMLADLGADVVRVDRPGDDLTDTHGVLLRGRRRVVLDLKEPAAVEALLDLAAGSDVLLEGFRPGVAERLGIGPVSVHARNPALVYGRMTGWGQDGPYAALAGHDITYLAVSGVLDAFPGADGRPVPPLNLLGDFGGGGMLLAVGVLAALLPARTSGPGQVVDAAIVDGVATMTAMLHSMQQSGLWPGDRGANLFDGGAPFYRCYRTSDDRWVAVGAVEPLFWGRVLDVLALDVDSPQLDRAAWPEVAARLEQRFASRTLAEWTEVFAGVDACVAPVLTLAEARRDRHLKARRVYAPDGGEPAPAPRFSTTATTATPSPAGATPHTDAVDDPRTGGS
jgi:alpha-methylacyl-CoA racemase